MKTNDKNDKPSNDKINSLLINLLSISLTFFLTIGSSVFFLGKLENRMQTVESEIRIVKSDLDNYKNNMGKELIEINKLNSKTIEDMLYIFQKYNDDEERKRMFHMTYERYNKEKENISKNKPTS